MARLPRRSGHDRAGSLSLAFLDFPVQHLQCVLLTGSEGERTAGRFPAVHRRRGYAEQAGELGDRESAPAAQLCHPAARRLEPGRLGAGPTRPPAAGPAASGGLLPSGRRAAVRRVEIDAEDVREIAGEDVVPCRGVRQRHVAEDADTEGAGRLATPARFWSSSGRRREALAAEARRSSDAIQAARGPRPGPLLTRDIERLFNASRPPPRSACSATGSSSARPSAGSTRGPPADRVGHGDRLFGARRDGPTRRKGRQSSRTETRGPRRRGRGRRSGSGPQRVDRVAHGWHRGGVPERNSRLPRVPSYLPVSPRCHAPGAPRVPAASATVTLVEELVQQLADHACSNRVEAVRRQPPGPGGYLLQPDSARRRGGPPGART